MAEARAAWQALQPEIAIDRLVFIDETGALTKTARRYGRSARGKGCVRFRPAWPLEVDDVRRRAQSHRDSRAHGARRREGADHDRLIIKQHAGSEQRWCTVSCSPFSLRWPRGSGLNSIVAGEAPGVVDCLAHRVRRTHFHQARHRVAGHSVPFPQQLPPHLAHPVDLEVLIEPS